jgi:hypothetical protein
LNLRHAKSLRVGLYLLSWAESNVQVLCIQVGRGSLGSNTGSDCWSSKSLVDDDDEYKDSANCCPWKLRNLPVVVGRASN